jgi:hypothetical protein
VRRIGFNVIAQGGYVQRIFVRRIGFGFRRSLRRTFDFLYIRSVQIGFFVMGFVFGSYALIFFF